MSNILLVVRDEECDWLAVDVINWTEGKYIDKVDCCIINPEIDDITDKAEFVYTVMDHFKANRIVFDMKTVSLEVIKEFHRVLYKNNMIMSDGGWVYTLD